MNLTEVPEKTTVIISAMPLNSRVIGKLSQLGIRLGSMVRVDRFAPFGGPVMICVDSREVALGKKLARKIEVENV